jgi:hypothetical protein
MNVRAICSGRFALPMPPADARTLFTPKASGDGLAPRGIRPTRSPRRSRTIPRRTVFTTESDDGDATCATRARVAHDRIAGTIDVLCTQEVSTDVTEVAVTYDVTSLNSEGSAFVEELEAGFDELLGGWRQEITAGLDSGRRGP